MRIPPLLPLVLATLTLEACSSIRITPQPGQPTASRQGQQFVVCSGKNAMLWIGGMEAGGIPSFTTRIPFQFYYRNLTASPAVFGLENITATDESGRKIRLYTARETERLERMERDAAGFNNMAARMGATSRAFAAPLPNFTDYTINYGAGGAGAGLVFNPAQQAVVAQSQSWNQPSHQPLLWTSRMLARSTVPPGGTVGGLVIVEISPVTNLHVRAGGEEFTANFLVK